MKTRRHHNNKGLRQIRRGKTSEQVRRMAAKAGVPIKIGDVFVADFPPMRGKWVIIG